MLAIEILLTILGFWFLVGLLFGVAFVFAGANKVNPAARESGLGLRLILLPGCALLWPWLLWLWARHREAPIECSYHRCPVEED